MPDDQAAHEALMRLRESGRPGAKADADAITDYIISLGRQINDPGFIPADLGRELYEALRGFSNDVIDSQDDPWVPELTRVLARYEREVGS